MSKRDMLSAGLANVRESMGDFAASGHRPGGPSPSVIVGPRATPSHLVGVVRSKDASDILLDRIERDPDQPREEFDEDELARLAASIKTHGLLQPIRVRWDDAAAEGRGAYVVLTGERRWRAARMAGLESIQCVVHSGSLDAGTKLGIQLIENALRHDLRPIEQAKAYRTLMDANCWTMADLSRELSIHKATVGRAMALLELPAVVQEKVEQGELSPTAGSEIAKLERPDDQEAVAQAVVEERLNQSEIATLVKAVKAARPEAKAKVVAAAAKPVRPEPIVYDTVEFTVTIKWKRAGGPAAKTIAGNLVRWLKMKADGGQAQGQGGESDAA